MSTSLTASMVCMDTFVTVDVVRPDAAADSAAGAVEAAFRWFGEVEARCSRFEADSELSRLSSTVDEDVMVSPLLFRAIEFAVAVARETNGVFDPTFGQAMIRQGFDTNYRTGERVPAVPDSDPGASFRDIILSPASQTVRLCRPLMLDLGAVAKGLAVDLAAQALRPSGSFAINAGGDMYFAGRNEHGEPWPVGIRHPRQPDKLVDSLRVSDLAVCTSGDYERHGHEAAGGHHILTAAAGKSATPAISATVIAPSAMLADALATAAFALGPQDGAAFLERQGVEGLLISQTLERTETKGFGMHRA